MLAIDSANSARVSHAQGPSFAYDENKIPNLRRIISRPGRSLLSANNQSDSNTQKGSQFANQGSGANRPGQNQGQPDDKNQPGKSGSGSQQSGSSGTQGSHAGSTGTGSGQISPQTHDTANAGRGQGSGARSSGQGNQKP